MNNIVIGIEGLVGAGKTSICRCLLKKYPNAILVNGGNIYRAIVYTMIKNGNKLEELKAKGTKLDIKDMMDYFKIEIKIENQETMLYIDGIKADEDTLQSKESSMAVSEIGGSANNKHLFEYAHNLIDTLKKDHMVIVSGRSVMKIYPECDKHFFITASLNERIKRKCHQYNNKEEYEIIKENIIKRDELQEKAGFYELEKITEVIDVTNTKSVEESTNLIMKKLI